MRSYLSRLPNADLPDVALEADLRPVPVIPPDDDDLIRPDQEDELGNVNERALASGKPTALAKYLIWTFGPDNQALPFHLQMRMEIEHDLIMSCDSEIGWRHQGIEKELEGRSYENILQVLARVHPRDPSALRLAFLLAVERSLGIDKDIPRRAQLWRMLIAELSRIAEHLLVLESVLRKDRRAGRFLRDLATKAQRLVELAQVKEGALLLCVGGLIDEPGPSITDNIRATLEDLVEGLRPFAERQKNNPWLRSQVGRLDLEDAIALAVKGPALRACGKVHDIRLSDPYFCYLECSPPVAVRTGGGVGARLNIRLDEIFSSAGLIARLQSALAEAPVQVCLPKDQLDAAKPIAFQSASIEAPAGELSFSLAHDEQGALMRVRIRSPSFFLAQSIGTLLLDQRLDDVLPILRSLGIVSGEVDR